MLLARCHRSPNLPSHKDFHFTRADRLFDDTCPVLPFPVARPSGFPSAAKVSMFCLAIKIVSPPSCIVARIWSEGTITDDRVSILV